MCATPSLCHSLTHSHSHARTHKHTLTISICFPWQDKRFSDLHELHYYEPEQLFGGKGRHILGTFSRELEFGGSSYVVAIFIQLRKQTSRFDGGECLVCHVVLWCHLVCDFAACFSLSLPLPVYHRWCNASSASSSRFFWRVKSCEGSAVFVAQMVWTFLFAWNLRLISVLPRWAFLPARWLMKRA